MSRFPSPSPEACACRKDSSRRHPLFASLHMPTLGFLKKKRTKEFPPGSNDPTSPTSPSSQTNSPIYPTTSRPFDNHIDKVTTSSSLGKAQSATQTPAKPADTQPAAEPTKEDKPTAGGQQPDMAQGVAQQQQQQHAYSPGTQPNLPSINNLINPPQHDGAGQSKEQSGHHVDQKDAQQTTVRQTKGKYSLGDFEIQRTLGTGSFGRVHLVQSKHNQRFYAVKVLKKQQVVKMKQVEHTNDERKMLQEVKHPFLITLWGTFQDSKNLYMVMDFVEGGELFSLLRKSQVWFPTFIYLLLRLTLSSDFPTPWRNSMLPK